MWGEGMAVSWQIRSKFYSSWGAEENDKMIWFHALHNLQSGGRSPSLVHRALGVAPRSAVCRALLCTRRSLHRPSQALRVPRA